MSTSKRSSSLERRSQRIRKPVDTFYAEAERKLRESLGSSETSGTKSTNSPSRSKDRKPSRKPVSYSSIPKQVVSKSNKKGTQLEDPKERLLTQDDDIKNNKKSNIDNDNDEQMEAERERGDEEESDIVNKTEKGEPEDEPMLSSSSDSEDDEEEYVENAAKSVSATKKRKSPTKSSKKSPKSVVLRSLRERVVQIQEPEGEGSDEDENPVRSKKARLRPTKGTKATGSRQAQTAIKAMAKKVLGDKEVESNDDSLLAALLYSTSSNVGRRQKDSTVEESNDIPTIAQRFADQLKNATNRAHIILLNLIFRSVGCRYENLMKFNILLDDLSDEELTPFIEQMVKDMGETPADTILFCADPVGSSVGRTGGVARPKLALAEYRRMYQEFWYELGMSIVVDNDNGTSNSVNSGIDDAGSLISRLMEFASLGVPDIRAAVSLALYKLAEALLYNSVQWKSKLEVAQRQFDSAKRVSETSRKAKALQQQVEFLSNSITAAEEILKENVMTVFLKRYRDKNDSIRAQSLDALSSYTLLRPDIFLTGMYLKYFGWLLSDKSAIVRKSAVLGLLAPFRENQHRTKVQDDGVLIDTTGMTSVIQKFLSRLADMVLDVDVGVQEVAMELLLHLVRNDFFDDVENDAVWNKINLRAIATDTSLLVRRDALYFVIEQLQQFDTGSSNSDTEASERIKALIEWLSHVLSDSDIPVEHVRYELADCLVSSLRSMPEHKALVCNWTAILQCLESDMVSPNSSRRGRRKATNKIDQREDAVQQRVLLRFLVASADLEVRSLSQTNFSNTMAQDIDKDILLLQKAENDLEHHVPIRKHEKRTSTSQEELTLALLRALPNLLISYKTEIPVLQNLTSLPRYLLSSVFNLPSRKKDFQLLVSTLSTVFLEVTDENILSNCALALVSLTRGDHARKDEALVVLKENASLLITRLFELIEEKSRILSDNDDKSESDESDRNSSLIDNAHALNFCLRRLRIISKRWYLPDLVCDGSNEDQEDLLHKVFTTIVDHFSDELRERQLVVSQENLDEFQVPEIWSTVDEEIHSLVATSISESLDLLLSIAAWKLHFAISSERHSVDDYVQSKNSDDHDDDAQNKDEDSQSSLILTMRNQMVKLVVLCYEQFIESEYADQVSICQMSFSDSLQLHAGRLTGDLRMLFPKEWAKAKSKLLSSLALTQETALVGGLVRFVRSQEEKLRSGQDGDDNAEAVRSLLLPLARGLAGNWLNGNRKEAGVALAHISGSGKEAHNLVQSLSRVCKKIHPVRLLESHMAYLRQDFNDWQALLPEELNTDRPTDEELAEFERAEKAHKSKFEAMEHRAMRLSASLGVGTIKDKTLAPALVGFVREGVRFAFSTEKEGIEESVFPGERLSFLLPLSKYLNWIRQNKNAKERVKQDLDSRESDLRSSPGYKEIYDEDKSAIVTFRLAGDLGQFPGALMEDDDITMEVSTVHTGTNIIASQTDPDHDVHTKDKSSSREQAESTNRKRSISLTSRRPVGTSGGGGGSVSSASIRSKFSSSQSLSPLEEGDEDAKDDDNHVPHNTEDSYDDDVSQLSQSPRRSRSVK